MVSLLFRMRFCFFFSSRRRHTRYWRDWSSDVCSSDLMPIGEFGGAAALPGDGSPFFSAPMYWFYEMGHAALTPARAFADAGRMFYKNRSEERRVGKKCKNRWSSQTYKEKI